MSIGARILCAVGDEIVYTLFQSWLSTSLLAHQIESRPNTNVVKSRNTKKLEDIVPSTIAYAFF